MKIKLLLLSFLFVLTLSLSLNENLFSQNQNTQETVDKPTPKAVETCREIYDSNARFLLPKKKFALIYFFSPQSPNSLLMKKLLENLTLKNKMPQFCVDITINKSLTDTYHVYEVPSIVIIQNNTIIYGTTGFVDDIPTLSKILNNAIANNRLI